MFFTIRLESLTFLKLVSPSGPKQRLCLLWTLDESQTCREQGGAQQTKALAVSAIPSPINNITPRLVVTSCLKGSSLMSKATHVAKPQTAIMHWEKQNMSRQFSQGFPHQLLQNSCRSASCWLASYHSSSGTPQRTSSWTLPLAFFTLRGCLRGMAEDPTNRTRSPSSNGKGWAHRHTHTHTNTLRCQPI